MTNRYLLLAGVILLGSAIAPSAQEAPKPGGYVLERDKDVAKNEPGTHKGGGETIGYSFFEKTPNLKLVFRKRAFKPGSAIGYHLQREDEIYYVLSGRGMMTVDGKEFEVARRTVFTRPGSSHGSSRSQGGSFSHQLRTGRNV